MGRTVLLPCVPKRSYVGISLSTVMKLYVPCHWCLTRIYLEVRAEGRPELAHKLGKRFRRTCPSCGTVGVYDANNANASRSPLELIIGLCACVSLFVALVAPEGLLRDCMLIGSVCTFALALGIGYIEGQNIAFFHSTMYRDPTRKSGLVEVLVGEPLK